MAPNTHQPRQVRRDKGRCGADVGALCLSTVSGRLMERTSTRPPAHPLRRPLSLRHAQSLLLDLNWHLHIATSRFIQRKENLDSSILVQAQSLTTPLNLIVQQQRPENLQGQP